jgi:hypothetical protein
MSFFSFVDPDAFYHAKLAGIFGLSVFKHDFPYLQFTSFVSGFADQHFLYHLLLYPFRDLAVLFLSVAVFGLMFLASFVFLLKRLDVINWFIWVVFLFFCSSDFLFRMSLVKGTALSLMFLCFGLFALLEKRYFLLFVVGFLFTLTYGGFVFLPVVVLLHVFANLLLSRELDLKSVSWSLGGVVLGILVHPYYPLIIPYLYDQIFITGLGVSNNVMVGQEWYPYSLFDLVRVNFLVLIAWFGGLLIYFRNYYLYNTKEKKSGLFLFFLSLFFFILMLKSQRFVEYWVPFATLFVAYALNPYLIKIRWGDFKNSFAKFWQFRFILVVLVFFVVWVGYMNIKTVGEYLNSAPRADLFRSGAEWVSGHSKQGEIVFNTQWDQFPQLFYWNDYNYYIVGMDPTFMYVYDKELYFKWRVVSDDEVYKFGSLRDLYRMMFVDFSSRFVFVEKDRNPRLVEFLDSDVESRYFEKGFEGERVVVYRLRK